MSETQGAGNSPAPHESGTNGNASGRGGRGRGNGNGNRSGRGSGGTGSATKTFLGNTAGMNGHVFQCHAETTTPLQFTKTVSALNDHVKKTLKYAEDVASICSHFRLTTIAPPNELTEEEAKSKVLRLILEKEVDFS